jgi:hypothetical protein
MQAFCLDTKKRERGRAWPYRQSGESRIVYKQNASSVELYKVVIKASHSLRVPTKIVYLH